MTFTTPDNTLKILTTVLILVLSSLACMEQIATVTPTPTASPTALSPPLSPTATVTRTPTMASVTAEDVQTAVIRATVYVRAEPDADSPEVGSLETGAEVVIVECSGEWCQIENPAGYVFRGCTSDNPDGLKCEVRE
jgi:hypothetical protein